MSTSEPPDGDKLFSLQHENSSLRQQLATLGPLLALSVLMTTSDHETEILELATSAMASLARCQCEGIHLDGGWLAQPSGRRFDLLRLESQLAAIRGRDGPVDVKTGVWGWAFPLHSLGEVDGHIVVTSRLVPEDLQRLMLGVMVQHAGVAIANVRLHSRQRALSDELRSAQLSLERAVAATELARAVAQRGLDIHRQLTDVAAAAEGVQGIASVVRRLSGRSVAVEDRHGNLLAWAGPDQPVPYPKSSPAGRRRLLRRVEDTGRPVRNGERLVWVARSGAEVFGVVALSDPDEESTSSDSLALEYAGTVLMLELLRLRDIAETELRPNRDLVEELLAGRYSPGLQHRATASGYDLASTHRVVVLDADQSRVDPETLLDAVRRSAPPAEGPALVTVRTSGVALLCGAEEDWEEVRRRVVAQLERGSDCRMGVGGRCTDHTGLPRSLEEAELALRMQIAGGGPATVTDFDQLGVYRLLGYLDDLEPVDQFARQWLGPILAHDAARDGALVETLSAYLEAGGNYDGAAAALSIHRSTLRYRLNRIREISGLDLNDPNTRFNMQLATRAWHTMHLLRPS